MSIQLSEKLPNCTILHPNQLGRRGLNGSMFSLTLGIVRPSRGWEMGSPCGFDLHFPMTNYVNHLCMCLWAIHVSSCTKRLFKCFVHYFVRLFVFLFVVKNSLFCVQILCQTYYFKCFLLESCSFVFLTVCFEEQIILLF